MKRANDTDKAAGISGKAVSNKTGKNWNEGFRIVEAAWLAQRAALRSRDKFEITPSGPC